MRTLTFQIPYCDFCAAHAAYGWFGRPKTALRPQCAARGLSVVFEFLHHFRSEEIRVHILRDDYAAAFVSANEVHVRGVPSEVSWRVFQHEEAKDRPKSRFETALEQRSLAFGVLVVLAMFSAAYMVFYFLARMFPPSVRLP